MKFYRVSNGDNIDYAATLSGAKDIVKTADPTFRKLITVDEVEMATDKDSLLALLNDNGTRPDGTGIFLDSGRSWTGTARGGLASASGEAGDD